MSGATVLDLEAINWFGAGTVSLGDGVELLLAVDEFVVDDVVVKATMRGLLTVEVEGRRRYPMPSFDVRLDIEKNREMECRRGEAEIFAQVDLQRDAIVAAVERVRASAAPAAE